MEGLTCAFEEFYRNHERLRFPRFNISKKQSIVRNLRLYSFLIRSSAQMKYLINLLSNLLCYLFINAYYPLTS